jgi:cell wall-associated NlpC family hydrolase
MPNVNNRKIFILKLLITVLICTQLNAKQIKDFSCLPDSVVNYAIKYIGTPYLWAGSSDSGFDCSGFVSFVYRHFQIETPNTSKDYTQIGTPILMEDCGKGDIILFSGTDMNKSIVGHVGIIVSKKGEPVRFIHSSSSKKHWGVVITD